MASKRPKPLALAHFSRNLIDIIEHYKQEVFMEISFHAIAIILRNIILLVVAIPAIMIIRRKMKAFLDTRLSPTVATLLTSLVFYAALALLGASILQDFGFNLSPFLGAAGLLTLALGFAAQTSISNIISGLFLVVDDTFKVGDMINVAGAIGIIESISFFSVKLRTQDNKLIRLSHEFLLKNAIINLNYYPQVRLDLLLSCPVTISTATIEQLIHSVLQKHPLVAKQPAPSIQVIALHEDIKDVLIKVWIPTSQCNQIQDQLISDLYAQATAMDLTIALSKYN